MKAKRGEEEEGGGGGKKRNPSLGTHMHAHTQYHTHSACRAKHKRNL